MKMPQKRNKLYRADLEQRLLDYFNKRVGAAFGIRLTDVLKDFDDIPATTIKRRLQEMEKVGLIASFDASGLGECLSAKPKRLHERWYCLPSMLEQAMEEHDVEAKVAAEKARREARRRQIATTAYNQNDYVYIPILDDYLDKYSHANEIKQYKERGILPESLCKKHHCLELYETTLSAALDKDEAERTKSMND